VATVTKPILFAAVAFAAFVFLYPVVHDRLPDHLSYGDRMSSAVSQSASQLSSEEFSAVDSSFTPDRLRAFAGDPAKKTKASVEGFALECWYYGIAGARGAYQICFENGRLSTKVRYGAD
jgi:hypothetical protein